MTRFKENMKFEEVHLKCQLIYACSFFMLVFDAAFKSSSDSNFYSFSIFVFVAFKF